MAIPFENMQGGMIKYPMKIHETQNRAKFVLVTAIVLVGYILINHIMNLTTGVMTCQLSKALLEILSLFVHSIDTYEFIRVGIEGIVLSVQTNRADHLEG